MGTTSIDLPKASLRGGRELNELASDLLCMFPLFSTTFQFRLYHLPHHMYATVPHFRLRELHGLLGDYPEYAEACVETENYLHPSEAEPRRPTVVEVLGPEYAVSSETEAFIDESLLDGVETDRDNLELVRQAGREAREDSSLSPGPTPSSSLAR
jgi:hypothetical protein